MPSLRRARVAVLSAMTAQGSRRPGDVVVRRESPPLARSPLGQDQSPNSPSPPPPPVGAGLPGSVHFSPPTPAPPPPTPARHHVPTRAATSRAARVAAARAAAGTRTASVSTSRTAAAASMTPAATSTTEHGAVPRTTRLASGTVARRKKYNLSPRPVVRKPLPPPRRPSGPRLPSPCFHVPPNTQLRFRGDRLRNQRPASVLWAQPGGSRQSTSSEEETDFTEMPEEEEREATAQKVKGSSQDGIKSPVAGLSKQDNPPDTDEAQTVLCVGGYALSPMQSRPSSARSEPLLEGTSISIRQYNHLRYTAPPKSASESQKLYNWRRYAPSDSREPLDNHESRSGRDIADLGTSGDRSLLITRSMNTSAPLMDDAFLTGDDSEAECDARRGDVSEGDVRSPTPATPPPAPPPSVATLRFSQLSTHLQRSAAAAAVSGAGAASVVVTAGGAAGAATGGGGGAALDAAVTPPASDRPPLPRPPSAGGACPRTRSCSPHTAHTTGCLPSAVADEGGGGGSGKSDSTGSSRPASPPLRPGTPRWR